MKSEHQKRVEVFHRLAGFDLPKPKTLEIPSFKERVLSLKLILEEAFEIAGAMGVELVFDDGEVRRGLTYDNIDYLVTKDFLEDRDQREALIEMADGFADLSVVNTRAMSMCGIHDVGLLEEVDYNNLMKFGPGHSFRKDGKLVKPPNHPKPRITIELLGGSDNG